MCVCVYIYIHIYTDIIFYYFSLSLLSIVSEQGFPSSRLHPFNKVKQSAMDKRKDWMDKRV